MRLCNRKFGYKLFRLRGFKDEKAEGPEREWLRPNNPGEWKSKQEVAEMLERCLNGTTGMGLIDASQRELFHTGYTSNRARQNVASFMTKHLHLDWRLGAEWYESMLLDYDVSNNWGNWQYMAGVGNDPRGQERIFNPVKQAFDYDPNAEYVVSWVQELRGVQEPSECFQAWTIQEEKRKELGLAGLPMIEKPLKKINFTVGKKETVGRGWRDRAGGGSGRRRGSGSGSGRRRRSKGDGRSPYGGMGSGSSRDSAGGGYGRGRGGEGGRQLGTSMEQWPDRDNS